MSAQLTGRVTTALLVRWTNGYVWVGSGDPGGVGRFEDFISIQAHSAEAAAAFGQAYLNAVFSPRPTIDMQLTNLVVGSIGAGGTYPYESVFPGDTVTIPAEGIPGSTEQHVVVGFTITTDPEGKVLHVPMLEAIGDEQVARLQRQLNRFNVGGQGLANVVQDVKIVPPGAITQPSAPVEFTWSSGGAFTTGLFPPSPCTSRRIAWQLYGSLGTAGSTDTTVNFGHNGSLVATLTIPAGQTHAVLNIRERFDGPATAGDQGEAEVTAVGTGALDLTFVARCQQLP